MPVEVHQRLTRLRFEALNSSEPTVEAEFQAIIVDEGSEVAGPYSYVRFGEAPDSEMEGAIFAALDFLPLSAQAMIRRWAVAQ